MALHDDDKGRGASLDTVLAELKRGRAAPCYLLCGDEEFLLHDALEKMTTALIPEPRDRELNLFVTDGEHEDIDCLCESLITPPPSSPDAKWSSSGTRDFSSPERPHATHRQDRERLNGIRPGRIGFHAFFAGYGFAVGRPEGRRLAEDRR